MLQSDCEGTNRVYILCYLYWRWYSVGYLQKVTRHKVAKISKENTQNGVRHGEAQNVIELFFSLYVIIFCIIGVFR